MPKIIARNTFVLLASRFHIKRNRSVCTKQSGNAMSHLVAEAPKKQEKQDHTKKLEYFNLQLQRRL